MSSSKIIETRARLLGRTASQYSALLLLLGLALSACVDKAADSADVTDTRTNWLEPCESNSDCSDELSCECGVCTRGCSAQSDCTSLAMDAVCGERTDCSGTQSLCLSRDALSVGDAAASNDQTNSDEQTASDTEDSTVSDGEDDSTQSETEDDTQNGDEPVDTTGEPTSDETLDTMDEQGTATETASQADASLPDETTSETSDAGTSTDASLTDAGACIAEEDFCFIQQFGEVEVDAECCADLACVEEVNGPDAVVRVCRPPAPPLGGWTGFTVRKGWGPCPDSNGCFLRHFIYLDGSVTIEEPEGTIEATLSAEDQTTLFAILDSAEFNTGMQEGFTCPEPPSDVGVTFELARSGVVLSQTVTGCVFGTAEPFVSINTIINKYPASEN